MCVYPHPTTCSVPEVKEEAGEDVAAAHDAGPLLDFALTAAIVESINCTYLGSRVEDCTIKYEVCEAALTHTHHHALTLSHSHTLTLLPLTSTLSHSHAKGEVLFAFPINSRDVLMGTRDKHLCFVFEYKVPLKCVVPSYPFVTVTAVPSQKKGECSVVCLVLSLTFNMYVPSHTHTHTHTHSLSLSLSLSLFKGDMMQYNVKILVDSLHGMLGEMPVHDNGIYLDILR